MREAGCRWATAILTEFDGEGEMAFLLPADWHPILTLLDTGPVEE